MSKTDKIQITVSLVRQLISTQFPQWAHLPIKPVKYSGWDNRTFHLGTKMSVRLPGAKEYALKVDKEHYWLPRLAPFLLLKIPTPVAMGNPSEKYPYHWSIYHWIDGENASIDRIIDLSDFAVTLGSFLVALQKIDSTGGPIAGAHNFYRGGPLQTYDSETKQAIKVLGNSIDTILITKMWNQALASTWTCAPVWVHGDVAAGNLLVKNGKLEAVIDFGGLGIGDPACDLAIAWTFFRKESREVFRKIVVLDDATWIRGCGWALWKALIVLAKLPNTNHLEIPKSKIVIEEILADYKYGKLK